MVLEQKNTYSITRVLEYINKRKLPEYIIKETEKREKGIFSFQDYIFTLREVLESDHFYEKEYKKYGLLYLCLIEYYSKDPENCLQLIKRILKMYNDLEFDIVRLLFTLKYRVKKMRKILLCISDKLNSDVYFKSLRRKEFKNFVDIKFISEFNEQSFTRSLYEKDQIFIVGHGGESGTKLGDQVITPGWLSEVFAKSPDKKTDIFGIFSCQGDFANSPILTHVDYFITDNVQSSPRQSELFCYGYLKNYLESFDIINSFQHGILCLMFILTGEPYFKIYENGWDISSYPHENS
ncbi:MAG: hypothetical protein IPP15_13820 [Saprospiraceae bacterium]|uniref:Uncharacterized protein n=1 Tax=Candidatus Opimibacter skivensis TaxID=2982028 RepID=A0A9D7XQW0_9BACT|nr:hypothetical protein [Candidatus Opimibacter skivensis]